MSDWLLVRLARDGSHPTGWVVASSSGAVLDASHAQDPAGLSFAASGRRVALLAPSGDVLHLSATLPEGSESRLAQVVPFALEDQVAEDPERLQFALGALRVGPDGATDVDVVSRELLDRWLAAARDAGLESVAVHAESTLVPTRPGQVSLLVDERCLVLRQEGQRPLVLPAADPATALELALADIPGVEDLLVTVNADARDWLRWQAAFESWRARLHGLHIQLLPGGTLPWFAAQLSASEPINLLQGAYAMRRPGEGRWRAWRVAVLLAAVLVVVQLVGDVLSQRRLRAQERALDTAIQQLFSQAMPGAVSGGRPRALIERRLAQLSAATAGKEGWLAMLTAVGNALREVPGAQLRGLEFQPGSLDLTLVAGDAQAVDRIAQALRAAGHGVNVMPTAESGKDREFKLQLKVAGP